MEKFIAPILRFKKNADKTGWTYIIVPARVAGRIKPSSKKSFRVKGKLDSYTFSKTSLLPMGKGDFLFPFNASIRKGTGKIAGETVKVQIEEDKSEFILNPDLMTCLEDEPGALEHFNSLTGSHQRYFSKWIDSAKTELTKARRIANAVNALSRGRNYAEMIRDSSKGNSVL